jgi:3,4-dihydroxy 2-butanone 4-phosphate synthase/GTP cyclohydrolase II
MTLIKEAIKAFQSGQPIIVYDGQKEMEGDILLSAAHATPELINWVTLYARGLICVAIGHEIAAQLGLTLMPRINLGQHTCGFLNSVDALHGITTGVSAYDRAKTIQLLADPKAKPDDFSSPGHIFPCLAQKAGLAERQGHTEATVYLCQLAGLRPAGLICEILDDDGRMRNFESLKDFAQNWDLVMISIDDLVDYFNMETQ